MGISYTQQSKGNWEYRIRYRDPYTGKHKEKSKRGFKTKPEARFTAQEMENKLLNHYEMATEDSMLKDFLNEWIQEYKRGVVRKNTLELHQRNINKHIIPYFDNIKLTNVKPSNGQISI